MAMNLYVGNMSFSTTEDTLREAFAQYGTVTKVQLIMDRETGRPRLASCEPGEMPIPRSDVISRGRGERGRVDAP